jgi:hypothetical protein
MIQIVTKRALVLSTLLLQCSVTLFISHALAADTKKAKVSAPVPTQEIVMEVKLVDGKKSWVPAVVKAAPGRILFKLVNHLPEPHGFNIPGVLPQPVVVQASASMDVPVEITKSGDLPIVCHMHPAHVGATLKVQ